MKSQIVWLRTHYQAECGLGVDMDMCSTQLARLVTVRQVDVSKSRE